MLYVRLLTLLLLLLSVSSPSSVAQIQRVITTAKGETCDKPEPHPLSWWIKNPLRLDADGDLMIGRRVDHGHMVTARDYQVVQSVTTLGILAGHRIIQIMTTIYPGPHVVDFGLSAQELPPEEWKSLLVQIRQGNRYVEIYRLQSGYGTYLKMHSAAIYGSGPNAILGTYDPDSGNGGGCSDGYWWFNTTGAQPVDFSLLEKAVVSAIPKNSSYTRECWALHPDKAELRSNVQRNNAECHACGQLGEVDAQYQIQDGAALPISVHFEPDGEK
jgi:hypothetical protein